MASVLLSEPCVRTYPAYFADKLAQRLLGAGITEHINDDALGSLFLKSGAESGL